MKKSRFNLFVVVVISAFFLFYLLWLRRAYVDVVWMDQVQWLAGNINHFYRHTANVQDIYYLTPYNQIFSICWALLNCKLFSYNTWIDNIASGIVLFAIALVLIRSNARLFSNRALYVFVILAAFMVFGLHKWEASLNGMGLGFYLTFLMVLLAIQLGHKYYLDALSTPAMTRYFVPLYMLLAGFAIIEYGPYYMAFQISMILVLLLNYKVLHDKINLRKWRTLLLVNLALVVINFSFDYLLEYFSKTYTFQSYPKVGMPPVMSELAAKVMKDPLFVIKFFLLANTGNLIDPESYMSSSFLKGIMPFVGLFMICCYGYCIYVYIKRRNLKLLYPVSLMAFVLVFYALVTLGRIRFNDLYYGTASRYTAVSFSAVLALVAAFLYFLTSQAVHLSRYVRLLYILTIALICFCYARADFSQWKIAPYRKEAYQKMAFGFKDNENLQLLQANTMELAEQARQVMIENKLNVFRRRTRLSQYAIGSDFTPAEASGFYEAEGAPASHWWWTSGNGKIYLPNLYTDKNSVTARVQCYAPNNMMPTLVLNDSIMPFKATPIAGGFEYRYHLLKEKVLFKATLRSSTYIPAQADSTNPDHRLLGIAFRSMLITD